MRPNSSTPLSVNGLSLDPDQVNQFPSVSEVGDHVGPPDVLNYETSIHDTITPSGLPLHTQDAKIIGVISMLLGLLTCFAGALEMFLMPLVCYPTGGYRLRGPRLSNFYGFTLYAGFFHIANGATSLRLTITQRRSTVNRLFAMHIITLLLYLTGVILIFVNVGFRVFGESGSCMKIGHSISMTMLVVGLLWQTTTLCTRFVTIYHGKTVTLFRLCVVALMNKIDPGATSCAGIDLQHQPLVADNS